ncbi:MAG: branched-chain amino acid ABC transporter substrate-binding protein, partial [Rhizobiales bacterium]|nr:branched-chain amino acid ABC transporter substrate-binding protein [Hyphomicrobiales bacterium]
FAAAAEKAKSFDPIKIALALENMEIDVFDGGKGMMRKEDHQFFQPLYVASFGELKASEPFDEEGTGWGNTVVAKIEAKDTLTKTSCKMTRPQ